MGLREQQRETARRAIVTAALSSFLESGYARTSIDDIAARADVSRRSVYNHFESKGEILLAAIDDRVAGAEQRSQERDHQQFAAIGDAREALAFFGGTTKGILERSLPLYRVVLEAAAHDGEVAKRLAAQEEARLHAQAFALRVLAEKGALRADVDFGYLQRGFWLLAGPRPALQAIDAGWTIDEYIDWLVDTLQRFLLPP